MEKSLPRVSPAPEDELRRQTAESYIQIDVDVDLELRHFKAILVLSSMSGMDLSIAQNAIAAEKALDRAVDLLSKTVRGWHWLDRKGEPYEAGPADNPDAFESLSMAEINWMIGAVSEAIRETATPEGT